MFIVHGAHCFQEVPVLDVCQNFPVHVLSLAVGFDGLLSVAFFPIL